MGVLSVSTLLNVPLHFSYHLAILAYSTLSALPGPGPAPDCSCSRGRAAGRGGCSGTGKQLGGVAGPQKASRVSALALSSFSGLVLYRSCGSHGRNATAEVLIFL